MTTTVIVKANHGWPVDVTVINPTTGEEGSKSRVEPNTEGTFHVYDTQDLRIHEVQRYGAAHIAAAPFTM